MTVVVIAAVVVAAAVAVVVVVTVRPRITEPVSPMVTTTTAAVVEGVATPAMKAAAMEATATEETAMRTTTTGVTAMGAASVATIESAKLNGFLEPTILGPKSGVLNAIRAPAHVRSVRHTPEVKDNSL